MKGGKGRRDVEDEKIVLRKCGGNGGKDVNGGNP